MVLCEMYYARQSPRPVLIKSLQKSPFIGRISQYFPAREVCDCSILTKLSLRMGLVPYSILLRGTVYAFTINGNDAFFSSYNSGGFLLYLEGFYPVHLSLLPFCPQPPCYY